MPIYAYKCRACGHQFDKIQRISDAPMVDCPACNQPELKKQLTAAAFKLTGTGWYETDFKHSKKPADKDSSSDKSSQSTKTDTKSTSSSKSGEGKSQAATPTKKDAA